MKNNASVVLSEYLEEKCISNIKFCRKIGITHSTLMKYIRGERVPSISIADAIHQATEGRVEIVDWVK